MNTVTTPFNKTKEKLLENWESVYTGGTVFYTAIDRDEIWQIYLNSFSEDSRQEYNCKACKSFIRQYGGIVAIEDNKAISIWKGVNTDLEKYVLSRPITDIFLAENEKCGVQKNLDPKTGTTWTHFFFKAPRAIVVKEPATKLGEARDNKNVLKRSLTELTLEATETVLELIGQNSLYRGKEFQPLLEKFVLLQRRFKRVSAEDQDNFCWASSIESGPALSRIRNTSIGTLLIDLSSGLDLETAVTKFERVVAPTNYKRPTSLVTTKMIDQAKETLSNLGLLTALERRYATEADIQVCNVLFKDKPQVITDVFSQMSKETLVNPKTFSKVEEIGIEDFVANVIPSAKSISLLVENSQMGNFVSVLTAQDPESANLFKWNNPFSWSYSGAVTDSIKERVKAAGGNVVGELRTSLSWFNFDDLDIHVTDPAGTKIWYGAKSDPTTKGTLDVDMNAGVGRSRSPVENIIWPDKSRMREGKYKVSVNNYRKRETLNSGFIVQIECNGEIFDFEFDKNPSDGKTENIVEFKYSKTSGITFKGKAKSNVVSKEKWGLKTNQFHKVTQLFLSPNHWETKIGNKHYLFMLEWCKSDEQPRPFFNEFLKSELDAHRKVFEILGSKVKIEYSDNQLSGLGFSDTQKSSIIVKVESKFQRVLKVNF